MQVASVSEMDATNQSIAKEQYTCDPCKGSIQVEIQIYDIVSLLYIMKEHIITHILK